MIWYNRSDEMGSVHFVCWYMAVISDILCVYVQEQLLETVTVLKEKLACMMVRH